MYVKVSLILGLLLSFLSTEAQNWTQLGSSVYGNQNDEFGLSISLSSDGSVLAVGAPSFWNTSYVKIFEKNINGEWEQSGQTIYENEDGEESGYSVSLSSDGTTVAVGIPKNHNIYQFPGYVCVYKNINGIWTQIGENIEVGILSEQFGWSVSINSDGSTVAVGTQYNGEGYLTHVDTVRVFKNIEGTWTQIGQGVECDLNFDLSSDGSILAVGKPWADDNGSNTGTVKVYKILNGIWEQIGNDIYGDYEEGLAGFSVNLSSEGKIVAVGAPYYGGYYHLGQVRVFQYINESWVQMGNSLYGNLNENMGTSIDLNYNGNFLAVKSHNRYARVYEYKNGYWEQLGQDFEADIGWYGNSVSFDASGLVLAVSEYEQNKVSIYGLLPNIISQPYDIENACEEENIHYTVQGEFTDNFQWQLSIDNGSTWNDLTDNEMYSGTSTNDLSVLTVESLNNYFYHCSLSNMNGSTTSRMARMRFDDESPNITAHPNQIIDANNDCEASLPDYKIDIVATDNCDSDLTVTQFPEPNTLISGDTNEITLTVTDNLGNKSEVSFNVVVKDNLKPIISCVDNQSLKLQEGQEEYTVSGTELDPLYTNDNCNIKNIENNYNYLSTLDGAKLPVGTNNIEWKLTDTDGNVEYCNFVATIYPSNGFLIYPIPTANQLFLKFQTSINRKIIISDITGKQLLERITIEPNETIDLSGFRRGIYIIRIQNDNKIYKTKIIKR